MWFTIILHFLLLGIFFSHVQTFIWFVHCSHKGFLPRFVNRLKDMNFLREDLIFSSHSEEVLLAFACCVQMHFYLADRGFLQNIDSVFPCESLIGIIQNKCVLGSRSCINVVTVNDCVSICRSLRVTLVDVSAVTFPCMHRALILVLTHTLVFALILDGSCGIVLI
jgi:hypothetical protein